MNRRHASPRLTALCCLAVAPTLAAAQPADHVAGPLIQLNDNGAWSWFMDERAIVNNGKLNRRLGSVGRRFQQRQRCVCPVNRVAA
jgi:hypothetical protein